MSAHEQEIVQRMRALRSLGSEMAAQLPRDLDRAKDWREHVKAHPIPAVLAAAAAGYAIVPGRNRFHGDQAAAVKPARPVTEAIPAVGRRGDPVAVSPQPSGVSMLVKPVVAALGTWAGRMAMASATGALQRLAAEHLQSFPTSFTKHGSAPSQRRGEGTEQRRAYTD